MPGSDTSAEEIEAISYRVRQFLHNIISNDIRVPPMAAAEVY